MIRALVIAAIALVSIVATPRSVDAQASPGDLALASSVTGLEGTLGTWVLAMPWGGFWHTDPKPGDPWAILGAVLAGGATSLATYAISEGHSERAELVSVVSAAGFGVALGVAMLGGLYNLLVDFDRLAVSLVYGMPILLAMTAGLLAGLVHLVVEGNEPAAMTSPLTSFTAPLGRFAF